MKDLRQFIKTTIREFLNENWIDKRFNQNPKFLYHLTGEDTINDINNNGLQTMFSPRCIFCSSNNSISLINDGSFRQCRTCNKQFKALFMNK